MMRNIESIRLYRDILRATRMFIWVNEAGEPWSKVLKRNARKEFEQSRYERDPTVIARLLFVGRDCLNQTKEKFIQAQQKIEENIKNTRNDK